MKNFSHSAFNNDVTLNGGYLYTTNAILSSYLANQRLTEATRSMLSLKNKKVIDVGCGDGTYTYELYQKFRPKQIVGIDAAKNAIELAKTIYKKYSALQFETGNIYHLEKKFGTFDVAIIRGVIHHVEYPDRAIRSVAKIAKKMVILEPNGYNPLLKIIEKVSLYHRIHKEKSYRPRSIRGWIHESGCKVMKDDFVGLVPFFCPDGMATFLKRIEKPIEDLPIISRMLCAVYVVLASTEND